MDTEVDAGRLLPCLAAPPLGYKGEPPRGIRNHNPGNILVNPRYRWIGQDETNDGKYCVFTRSIYGLRALAVLLTNYMEHDGIDTIGAMVTRFAGVNTTSLISYQAYVAEHANRKVGEVCDLHGVLPLIMEGIVGFECALWSYPRTCITDAVRMARTR